MKPNRILFCTLPSETITIESAARTRWVVISLPSGDGAVALSREAHRAFMEISHLDLFASARSFAETVLRDVRSGVKENSISYCFFPTEECGINPFSFRYIGQGDSSLLRKTCVGDGANKLVAA